MNRKNNMNLQQSQLALINVPKRNRHWLKEIQKALTSAEKQASNKDMEIAYLYQLALDYVIKNRGIDNLPVIREMQEDAENRVQGEWRLDDESKAYYKFHFVSSYIFSHVPAGLIEELEGDKVMNYINDNMNLFSD